MDECGDGLEEGVRRLTLSGGASCIGRVGVRANGRLGGSCGGGGISGGPSADRAGAGGTGSGVGGGGGTGGAGIVTLGGVGEGWEGQGYRSCSPVRHTETGRVQGRRETRVTEQSEERFERRKQGHRE